MSTNKYVINNELTEEAYLTTDLIKKCTFNVGSAAPVRLNEDEKGQGKNDGTAKMQYYQKFIDITYPNGEKSASMIIPDCVMHHEVHDYYGKPSIYVAISQNFVREVTLKLSTTGNSPLFQDKKILSDGKYWWTRVSMAEASEGKEYIRMSDAEGEDYIPSFTQLFAEYPTSMLTNITCTLKLKAEGPHGEPLKGNEVWRAGLLVSMFSPFDAIDVPVPSTGIGQRSMVGKRDHMKSGLMKFRRPADGA